jgi:hypothetical protein
MKKNLAKVKLQSTRRKIFLCFERRNHASKKIRSRDEQQQLLPSKKGATYVVISSHQAETKP